MKTPLIAAAILLLTVEPALAHRVDEYLQGTLISIEKDRIQVEMTLTPGVAVLPAVLAAIGTDGNAYALRVLGDLSLRIDDQVLTPRLLSVKFPDSEEMRDGRGEIRIEFDVALPSGGPQRKLIFENHHLSRIAAYQVNCLVPRDPDIRIVAQNRNYSQSFYELEFTQPGIRADLLSLAWLPGARMPLGTIALLLGAGLVSLWRLRVRTRRRSG